jgi:hypothetical protein
MLVVDPKKRASIDELLNCDIMKKRIAMARKNIITNEIKGGKKSNKVKFMETIKLPRNLREINSKLPKNRYMVEDEMMQNDEYETMKATFFQELNNPKNNNKINFNNYDNNINYDDNNNNYQQKFNINNKKMIDRQYPNNNIINDYNFKNNNYYNGNGINNRQYINNYVGNNNNINMNMNNNNQKK